MTYKINDPLDHAQPQIEVLLIAKLMPWASNARTHSKKQIKQIASSIQTFGFTNPVLIDDELSILAGHGRVAAAKLLGLAAVPCVRLSHMSPEQKRACSSRFGQPGDIARRLYDF